MTIPHQHPAAEPVLPENVRCTRCRVLLAESKSIEGAMSVRTHTPGINSIRNAALCGTCAFPLLEYLVPKLETDPLYQSTKKHLIKLWESR